MSRDCDHFGFGQDRPNSAPYPDFTLPDFPSGPEPTDKTSEDCQNANAAVTQCKANCTGTLSSVKGNLKSCGTGVIESIIPISIATMIEKAPPGVRAGDVADSGIFDPNTRNNYPSSLANKGRAKRLIGSALKRTGTVAKFVASKFGILIFAAGGCAYEMFMFDSEAAQVECQGKCVAQNQLRLKACNTS